MKFLIFIALFLSSVSYADEVAVGLSTTHIFSDTWKDTEGKSHPYNEDNNFISYTNEHGVGVAVFYNSYRGDSLLAYRTFSVPFTSYRQLPLSYGASIGVVTGYRAKGGADIIPVFSPHIKVNYNRHALRAGWFNLYAVVVLYGYSF